MASMPRIRGKLPDIALPMAEYLLEPQELPAACTGWEHLLPTDSLRCHPDRTLIAYFGAWNTWLEGPAQVAVPAHRRVATAAGGGRCRCCRKEVAVDSLGAAELLNLVEFDGAAEPVAAVPAAAESSVVEGQTCMAD